MQFALDVSDDQGVTVGREGGRTHFAVRKSDVGVKLPRARVPDLHMAVGMRRDETFTIRGKLSPEHAHAGISARSLEDLERSVHFTKIQRKPGWYRLGVGQ